MAHNILDFFFRKMELYFPIYDFNESEKIHVNTYIGVEKVNSITTMIHIKKNNDFENIDNNNVLKKYVSDVDLIHDHKIQFGRIYLNIFIEICNRNIYIPNDYEYTYFVMKISQKNKNSYISLRLHTPDYIYNNSHNIQCINKQAEFFHTPEYLHSLVGVFYPHEKELYIDLKNINTHDLKIDDLEKKISTLEINNIPPTI